MQDLIGKTVVFTDKIEEMEAYPEKGMRAKIVSVEGYDLRGTDVREHVYKIVFDYSEHDEFNKRFETSNYYDHDGVPNKTAREANMYEVEERIYFGAPELYPFESYFTFVDARQRQLAEEFKASGAEDYVAWLEAKVIAAG